MIGSGRLNQFCGNRRQSPGEDPVDVLGGESFGELLMQWAFYPRMLEKCGQQWVRGGGIQISHQHAGGLKAEEQVDHRLELMAAVATATAVLPALELTIVNATAVPGVGPSPLHTAVHITCRSASIQLAYQRTSVQKNDVR